MTPAELGAFSTRHQASLERLERRLDYWGAELVASVRNAPYWKPREMAKAEDFLPKEQKPQRARKQRISVEEQMRRQCKLEAEIQRQKKRQQEQREAARAEAARKRALAGANRPHANSLDGRGKKG